MEKEKNGRTSVSHECSARPLFSFPFRSLNKSSDAKHSDLTQPEANRLNKRKPREGDGIHRSVTIDTVEVYCSVSLDTRRSTGSRRKQTVPGFRF